MRHRDKWLNQIILRKVYNSGERNDGIAIIHNRQVKNVGKVRGYEFDRMSFVPFFDAQSLDGKTYSAWQSRKKKIGKGIYKFHPIVGIDYVKAKELAYAILEAIDEPVPTQADWDARQDNKHQEEIKKKIKEFGL